jgi:hypothetical protein
MEIRNLSEEKLNPQMQGTVNLMTAVMGLTLAMKQRFGDGAIDVTKNFVEQMGVKMGNQVAEKAGIEGHDLKAISKTLHTWQDPIFQGPAAESKIEGKTLTMIRKSPSRCPALYVAKQMKDVPLELICNTVSFPMFRGVAKAVNQQAKHKSLQISQEKCVDVIELP